jgi:hypothetical protein
MSCADSKAVPHHETLVAVLVLVATSALVVDLVAALAADVATLGLTALALPPAPTPLPSTTRRTSPHSKTLSGKLTTLHPTYIASQDTNTLPSALAALENADEDDNKDSAANETASPPAAQSSGEAQS